MVDSASRLYSGFFTWFQILGLGDHNPEPCMSRANISRLGRRFSLNRHWTWLLWGLFFSSRQFSMPCGIFDVPWW